MKKRIALIIALLMVLTLFVSCGAVANDATANLKGDYEYSKGESASGSFETDYTDKDMSEDALQKKIIKTYRLYLESKKFDEAVALIVTEAEKLGCYISSSSISGNASTGRSRSADYTVRVPSALAEAYIEALSSECNVLSSTLTTEDITDSYYGAKARMESLVDQEARLLVLLNKAENLSDMLAIEDKLADVRAELNALNKQLQLMDKSVDYSYVYIDLCEVIEYHVEDPTYLERLGDSFGDSFVNFAEVLGEALIIFIWILPFLLVGGVIAAIAVTISLKKGKNKKNNDVKDKNEK